MSAVISTSLGGCDPNEKFVPENEASSDEEVEVSSINPNYDENLILSCISKTPWGVGYRKHLSKVQLEQKQ